MLADPKRTFYLLQLIKFFTFKKLLNTLNNNLGCFPLDYKPFNLQSAC